MSQTPVPLPSAAAPTDVPAWLSTDAEEWARLRPAAWARPVWPVLALIVTVVSAMAVSPDVACSEAAPCGPDWVGMAEVGLTIGMLYWLARLPELALITTPVLGVIVAWVELPGADEVSLAVNVAVIAALAFGWASARERLAARGRQRRLVERAAGVRDRLQESLAPLPQGGISIAVALLLCVVAAASVVMGLRGIQADEDHAAHATRTTGRVIHRGEDSIRLRTADARHLTVDALAPEDYHIGSTVTVLEDGSWRRLAAEPYDAMGWQLLLLATALPGLSLFTVGILARTRTASLRRTPLQALRVLQRIERTGELVVYAADDTTGLTPLLACNVLPSRPGAAGSLDPFNFDEPDEPDGSVAVQLREAVMFGAPYEGAELVFVTTGRDAAPMMLSTYGSIHPLGSGKKPRRQRDQIDLEQDLGDPDLDRVAANLKPTGDPMWWGPGRMARGLGLVVAIIAGLGETSAVSRLLRTDGLGWDVIAVFGPLLPIHVAATLLNWRVTVDEKGLWLNSAWRLRYVPWERLRAVTYTKEGRIVIRLTGGETWRITVGALADERRLRIRPSYVRMAEEINVLRLHPERRPTAPVHPQDRGRPAGPLLLLGIVMYMVSTITM